MVQAFSTMTIRPERSEDASRVRHVNELAFGQPMEADLVERLRQACTDSLSLVAEDDAVVGHILFTPVVIESAERRVLGMGLAPMAVLPGRQRQGIGSQLVRRGLDILHERGCPFVVVVGHPEYYQRFGFEPASTHRLASQWEGVPDAAFMVLILDAHAMAGVSGVAKYRAEFSEVALEGEMIERQYLEDCLLQLWKLKELADKAIGQIEDEHLFAVLDPEANSIAVIMKHMAGNMRSRWTDFLTSDGEKPDRDRDREFELDSEDTRANILSVWNDGWSRAFQALSSLNVEDLGKTILIRGEDHSVVEAINRQMTHYAAHVGQIVLLAKHYAGSNWRSLSIPRGKSKEFDVAKSGAAYNVEPDIGKRGHDRAKPGVGSSTATYLAIIAAALLLVGVVSRTPIRHLVQIAPLVLALVFSYRRSVWGVVAAVPLFAFWLLIMSGIWLFLLGIARVFPGTFSPIEITLTLVIGTASIAGLAAAYRQNVSTPVAARLVTVIVFAILQFGAMWLSVQPFVARR